MRIFLIFLILFCFISLTYIQAEQNKGQTVELKRVQGEVSSLSPKVDPLYIGIVYLQDEAQGADYEIILRISKNTSITHKKSLSEISIGDSVDVTYEVITGLDEAGVEQSEKVAKDIQFVSAADDAVLAKYGLKEDPVDKFRSEKIREMAARGEWPLKGTPAEIEELKKKKLKEWEKEGKWPIKDAANKALKSSD